MIRLDRYLCELNIGSRSQMKDAIKKGLVTVNGQIIKTSDYKLDESVDQVCFQGTPLIYQEFVYYMLHKPSGVVTANKDPVHKTVMDLLKGVTAKNLAPVGRLDKDTEGLLLITNDGNLAHQLLSPSKHVPKTYLVKTAKPLSSNQIKALEEGIDIGEKKPCLPAIVRLQDEYTMELTIQEGKFHQIKRMLHGVDNEVVYLKRIKMGSLTLDPGLPLGSFRLLTPEEINQLK